MNIGASFEFFAYTVPAIMVLGGILLLFVGYLSDGGMIGGGWALVIIGALIYIIEILFAGGKGRSK